MAILSVVVKTSISANNISHRVSINIVPIKTRDDQKASRRSEYNGEKSSEKHKGIGYDFGLLDRYTDPKGGF